MKKTPMNLFLVTAISLAAGFLTPQSARAQGNFDPSQFRQRALDGYRERLDVKSDEDWNKLEPLIVKVMDAQRDARMGMGFPGFGRGGRGRGGDGGGSDQGGNRGRFGGPPHPTADALEKAIDSKASADELKTKLAKYREARKEKEDALTKAQDELRKVLSPRQEAGAVLAGLVR